MKRIENKLLGVLFIAGLLLNCCNNLSQKQASSLDISFLSLNVWQEGTSVPNGFNKIRDVIIETKPDIIGFSEVRNYENIDWTNRMLKALSNFGIDYHGAYTGGDVSIISKYPINESKVIYQEKGSIVQFEIDLGTFPVFVAVAHLDYTQYACYLPRGYNGGSPDWKLKDDGNGSPQPVKNIGEILAYNQLSERDEQIKAFIKEVATIESPIILMGDFNEPSYLDWTENSQQLFDHNGMVINWPVTFLLEKSGFIDSYRAFFPDEVKNPGFTWPSYADDVKATSWTPLADERDRIDYVFYKGDRITTKYAAIVGPKASYVRNQIDTSYTLNENFLATDVPWPSDHKGVFIRLQISSEIRTKQ